MSSGSDRRPWLILSRREIRILVEALPEAPRGPHLRRVLGIIAAQEAWIDGLPGTIAPSVARALNGEYGCDE